MANMMISIEDTPDGKSVILRITSDPLFEIIKELSEGNCSIAQRMGAAALGTRIHVAGGGPVVGGMIQTSTHEAFLPG